MRQALADDIVLNVMSKGFTEDQIKGVQDEVDALRQYMDDNPFILEPGFQLEDFKSGTDAFLEQCQQIIEHAGMTVDQANAFFDALGFETTFVTKEQDVTQKSPKTVTKTEVTGYTEGVADTPSGGSRKWSYPILRQWTYTDGYSEETGKMETMAMSTNGKTPIINSITRKASAPMNNRSSSNRGGSGGSKSGGGGGSQKARSKDIDRYHEINAKIEQNAHALEMLNKEESRAYGQDKLDLMDEKIKLLEEQAKLYEQLAEEAKNYYEQDKANLEKYGASFNKDGTIANYDQWYGA